jgi:type IV secretory pathway component VirB8
MARAKFDNSKSFAEEEQHAKIMQMSDIEDLRERRYLWTARAFTVVFVISFCANIVLIISILNMIPLNRVEPFMLTFQDKTEQIVNIEPLLNISDSDVITESYVRQYVVQRNALLPDINEMTMRWGTEGPVRYMSSPVVYQDFVNQTRDALEQAQNSGFTRSVDIISVNRLSKDVWQAEIETKDMSYGATEPDVSRWTIILRIGYFLNPKVKYSLRLKNPVGFTVREYSMKLSNNR